MEKIRTAPSRDEVECTPTIGRGAYEGETMSSTELENKEISRIHAEEFLGEGNLNHVDEHIVDDYVWHRPGAIDSIHGPDEVKEFGLEIRNAFPDLEVTVKDIFAKDDKVVRRDQYTGTHDGEYMGIPPTGKEIESQAIVINRFEDGQMVESWGIGDTMGLLQQLGFIVMPGPRLMVRMGIGKVKSVLFSG